MTYEVRNLALSVSSSRMWVEKVRWQTAPRRELDADPTSPVGVLLEYLREVEGDETELKRLAESLDGLARKLPAELVSGEDALAFNDPEQIGRWLADAESLLFDRLGTGGEKA